MSEEKNYFTCGYCIYGQLMEPPPEKKKDYPVKRGYCIFNPPAVFPMPSQQQQRVKAMGQPAQVMDFHPFMLRPVVDEDEPMCGRGVLNAEAMEALGIENKPPGCGGCKDEGDGCGC
jgi:hypothetical protein